jgi:hypothetical protein
MNQTSSQLPAGFETLEPFVARWAVTGANNRAQLRVHSTPEEREAFYAAARDLVAPALDKLDAKPLDQFDPAEQRLMKLLLAFAHAAMAVEVQGDDEPKHASMSRHMTITRAPADA